MSFKMDLDDFDNIDDLLDFEDELLEEVPAVTPKRNINDAGDHTEPLNKRPRSHATATDIEPTIDDEELYAIGAEAAATQTEGFTTHVSQMAQKARPGRQRSPEQLDSFIEQEDDVTIQEDLARATAEAFPEKVYIPPAREITSLNGAAFLAVTGPDGDRVYCQVEAPHGNLAARNEKLASSLRKLQGNLLSTSMTELIRAVEKDQFDRALAAEKAMLVDTDNTVPRVTDDAPNTTAKAAVSSLWVDRYSPSNFMDLLGNEQINREVVHWLKSWDPCVFNRAAPKALKPSYRGRQNNNYKPNQYPDDIISDSLGRPEHKIILLSGPPGIGKTTLAHIVARHCGYRPFEINASDDRNSTTLMSRIIDAVEMKSVMGEKLPNCVIVDEIDGVSSSGGGEGRSAIQALLKIVTAAPKSSSKGDKKEGNNSKDKATMNAQEEDSDDEDEEQQQQQPKGVFFAGIKKRAPGSAGKERKKKLRPLIRPIICICNDLYAPALRPLREVAKVFYFKKPMAERLVNRLQAVCAAEGLRAEKSTLRILTERTDCDIRSCLNTLQFLAKRQTIVRPEDLAGLNVGQKDMTKGAFHIWTDIFQTQKPSRNAGKQSPSQQFYKAFSLLQDFGEEELVLNGIHENLPSATFMDMTLRKTVDVYSHLEDADRLMRGANASNYMPALFMGIRKIVASHERKQLQWPKTVSNANRRAIHNQGVLHQWLLGMLPAAHAALGRTATVLDVLPSLPRIANPSLRPVSFHLFSKDEKAFVQALVGGLIYLGLNFSLDDKEDQIPGLEQYANDAAANDPSTSGSKDLPLKFKPPVHHLWRFEGAASASTETAKVLPVTIRQQIAHEIDMEAIRRAEARRRDLNGPDAMLMDTSATKTTEFVPTGPVAGRIQLDLAQRLREAGRNVTIKESSRPCNWLDQLRDKKAVSDKANKVEYPEGVAPKGPAQLPVLYKYHEGYTNAVKRPVLMQELL